uniref:Uncharacterized protein n=1 Tax=Lactuca sativa TaxID=4236 RepID=A0A9R1XQZ2_LACSA|nr:hypothetical protein LSAT_V11C300152170 [Lactuca sativa]
MFSIWDRCLGTIMQNNVLELWSFFDFLMPGFLGTERQLCWLEALHGNVYQGYQELHDLLPPSISNGIHVITSPYGVDSAWYGAKLLSNLSTFPNSWCITEETRA